MANANSEIPLTDLVLPVTLAQVIAQTKDGQRATVIVQIDEKGKLAASASLGPPAT